MAPSVDLSLDLTLQLMDFKINLLTDISLRIVLNTYIIYIDINESFLSLPTVVNIPCSNMTSLRSAAQELSSRVHNFD